MMAAADQADRRVHRVVEPDPAEPRMPPARRFRRSPARGVTDGFAGHVDREYAYYARQFAPAGTDRAAWACAVQKPMRRLRDEMVELYGADHTDAGPVRWLIRFQVTELRRAWDDGTFTKRHRRDQRATAYWFAYQRWRHFLDGRPSEAEIAQWID